MKLKHLLQVGLLKDNNNASGTCVDCSQRSGRENIVLISFTIVKSVCNRPGNRATLGLLLTYFYYCRIVGLIPVIPYPPKNNW